MFAVGDTVVRIERNMPYIGMYIGDTFEVAACMHRYVNRVPVITLVGFGSCVFYEKNFELAQPAVMVSVSSSDYMNDDALSIEDKQIITEALSND